MSEQIAAGHLRAAPGWRPKLGLLLFMLFILALLSALLMPLVVFPEMPAQARAALAGLLLFGLPMALMLAVVALVGQPAFAFIKGAFAWRDNPPAAVGLTRYRIGAVLALISILVSWLEPVLSPRFPEIAQRRVLIGALADGLALVGLCVLGGEFWDKFHALFVHDARVVPDPAKGPREAQAVRVTWRFYAGAAMLACVVLDWGLIPLASAAGWSTRQVASLTGGLFIANKLLFIGAVAIMGKDGFSYLKSLVSGVASKVAPPRQVSPGRYRLGLILLLVPVLMTWIAPYITGFVQPGSVYGFLQHLSLEVLVLVGLFLLGGEFWDKVRALFRHRAKVEIPRTERG